MKPTLREDARYETTETPIVTAKSVNSFLASMSTGTTNKYIYKCPLCEARTEAATLKGERTRQQKEFVGYIRFTPWPVRNGTTFFGWGHVNRLHPVVSTSFLRESHLCSPESLRLHVNAQVK